MGNLQTDIPSSAVIVGLNYRILRFNSQLKWNISPSDIFVIHIPIGNVLIVILLICF